MPNYCECDLIVEGPNARVTAFFEFAKGIDTWLDFGRFVPYPEEFAKLDRESEEWFAAQPGGMANPKNWLYAPKDGFNSGGHEWRVENWGTKWNARHITFGEFWEGDTTSWTVVHFKTAWSPPLPVIKRAAEMFPELTFELRYFECRGGFNGMLRCEGGSVTFDERGPYFGNWGG